MYDAMPKEQQQDFVNSPQFNLTDLQSLKNMNPDDMKHWQFMNETKTGETLGAVAGVGRGLTKGSLQVLKGVTHLMGALSGNRAEANVGGDIINEKLDKLADMGLTKGDIKQQADNPVQNTVNQLAEIAPSILGGEAAGSTKAIFALQGVGQGKEMLDEAEKNGTPVDPRVKQLFPVATGIVNGVLMGDAGENLFAKLPNKLRSDIVNKVTADAIKENAGKEVTQDMLKSSAASWTDRLKNGGVNYLKNFIHTGADLSALTTANYALEKGADKANSAPIFNNNDLVGDIGHSLQQAAVLSIPGALSGILPYSKAKDDITQSIADNPTPQNVETIKANITKHASENGWKQSEMTETLNHVQKIADAAKSLPETVKPAKKIDAINLILGRNELQNQLDETAKAKQSHDPALQDIVSPGEQLLTDKIEQANDKLRDIVTDTKTTYSKGIADEDGKFFKTTGDVKEEISPSRYQLENIERESKKNTPASDNEAAPVVPEEAAPAEPGTTETDTAPINEGTTNNQLITKSENDGKENDATEEKESGEEKSSSDAGQETVADEKGNVTQHGGDEPPVAKPKFVIKGDKVELKTKDNAISESKAESVPVQSETENSEGVPKGNTEREETAAKSEEKPKEVKSKKPFSIKKDKTVAPPKAGDPLRDFASKVRDGKIAKLGGFRSSSLFDKAWDGSLEAVATAIEGGAKLVDAIDAGLKHIRTTKWYKKLKEKDDFEAQYKAHLTKEYEGKADPTGIRNADVAAERSDEGKPQKARDKMTKGEIESEGKRLVDSKELDPDELAKSVVNDKKPITAEQQAALLYHKTKLKNAQRAILKDSGENPENAADNEIKYARNQDLLDLNQQATEIAGNITGRALGFRTETMNEDFSRNSVFRRAQQANNGEELSERDKTDLESHTKRIDELEDKLADREEQIRKLHENGLVDKVKRAADTEARNAKRTITKASLKKEREDLLADLHIIAKNSMGKAGLNSIPVEMAAPLAKLARNYVLDGIVTLSGVVDKIYSDLKDHVDGLQKDDIADLVKDNFDSYLREQNDIRLDRSKKLQQTKLEKLKEQNETGNFEKQVQRKIEVDNDYLRIRADINREQTLINKKIDDIRNSNKSIGRRAADLAVKWGRNAKLASVTVLGKLAATGLTTMGLKAVTEGVGAGFSKLLPKIAAKSTIEGGINLRGLGRSYAKAAFEGMKDSAQELNIKKGGQSDLSALYGKYSASRLPAEAADFFGHLHSAIKAPIKRQAWEYSYAKRFAKTAEMGLDPTDPVIDAQNRLNAYKDAERAIFMGDNKISSVYEAAMKVLENSNSSGAKNVAALTRILLPFVKVPTNILLSAGRYSFGLVPGLGKLAQIGSSDLARRAGAETLAKVIHQNMGELTPEESDMVLRNLKHGSVGGAALLLGFYNPKNFGGFYQPGEHRKKNDAEEGGIKVGNTDIPKWLTEHPIFLTMQIGATFRRVMDANRHKSDNIQAAALATASGMAGDIPLANGAKQIFDAIGSTHKFNTFVGGQIKGEFEPAAMQQLAAITDTKDHSAFTFDTKNQVQRKPDNKHGFIKYTKENLETGIPGLRKNVRRKND